MTKNFITIERMQALEESIGFLSNLKTQKGIEFVVRKPYSYAENQQSVKVEIEELPEFSKLLNELAQLNDRKEEIVQMLMACQTELKN